MSAADVLDQAADLLEKEGWGKGVFYNPETGCFCTIGALRKVAGGQVLPHGHVAEPKEKEGRLDYEAAHRLLSTAVDTPMGSVAAWNDLQTDETTVLTLLRNTAARARR